MTAPDSEALRTRLLILIRGAVDWTGVEDGDPPLAAPAALDAELTSATLPHFGVIVASEQRASRETAQALVVQRPVTTHWRADLDEIRTSARLDGSDAYSQWLDRLFESYEVSADGESLAEGARRMAAALRTIGDSHYGRVTLVVSHPVIALAFRGTLIGSGVSREQIEALPDLAVMILDYLEGRFYVVQDFPVRQPW